jgi:phosphatidylethanolamine-binding protein (PEBP) family uncharacterized protein
MLPIVGDPQDLKRALAVLAILAFQAQDGNAAMTLQITSSSFSSGAAIPSKHTCQGADVSPALAWSGVPPGTKGAGAHR